MFLSAIAAALNVVPGLIHPVVALSRLQPSIVQVGTLVVAHMASTTAAAAFGFVAVLGLRELLHAILGTTVFRRVSIMLRAGLVVALVTTLLLIPAMSFRVINLWIQDAITTTLLPPLWFAGLHDVMSGHIWAQLPRPELPRSMALSERAFDYLYRSRRPLLHQLGLQGGATFLVILLVSAAAYVWNNRRLPAPPASRKVEHPHVSLLGDAIAKQLVARRPLVRAGFFFTMRVLARSVQNRLAIGIPLAVAIAVATVGLRIAGLTSSLNFSDAPVASLAVQLLLVTALIAGFRHSVRVPADLRARWLFHLIRPPHHAAYLRGVKRAAIVKLALPALLALLPLHVSAFGERTAMLHFAYGLLASVVLSEALLLGYGRLPFASSYVPTAKITTHGGIYAFVVLMSVYTLAWLEYVALGTATGTVVLFLITATVWVVLRGIDMWQRRHPREVDLDELLDPPTLRLGLTE